MMRQFFPLLPPINKPTEPVMDTVPISAIEGNIDDQHMEAHGDDNYGDDSNGMANGGFGGFHPVVHSLLVPA
uniref:Uncharacterized protein n=1 Tax=Ditylenchus dipsaci TaxID=166011 RepID=A0A915ETJ6_9BILA